jgi:hypothetical protein
MAKTVALMADRLRKMAGPTSDGNERKRPNRRRDESAAAAGEESNIVVIPVRLRQSQLRLLQVAAEGASKRLGQQVSVSTVIAALITKYRSELAAEVESTPTSE